MRGMLQTGPCWSFILPSFAKGHVMARQVTSQQIGDSLIKQGYTPVKLPSGGNNETAFAAPPEKQPLKTQGWKVLQRKRRWVLGCTITESVRVSSESEPQSYRRFTATIRGWQNFKIWEGYVDRPGSEIIKDVIAIVKAIRDRIDKGDESDFYRPASTPGLRCQMEENCRMPVTHIDNKGFVYCHKHGAERKDVKPCRQLTADEIKQLQRGEALASY